MATTYLVTPPHDLSKNTLHDIDEVLPPQVLNLPFNELINSGSLWLTIIWKAEKLNAEQMCAVYHSVKDVTEEDPYASDGDSASGFEFKSDKTYRLRVSNSRSRNYNKKQYALAAFAAAFFNGEPLPTSEFSFLSFLQIMEQYRASFLEPAFITELREELEKRAKKELVAEIVKKFVDNFLSSN